MAVVDNDQKIWNGIWDMNVVFFDDRLEEFIQKIDRSTMAKVLRTVDLLERYGPILGMPHCRRIDGRIAELKVRGQVGIRIFFVFHKNTAVLLHGFMKKSQRTPQKELKAAERKLFLLDES